MLPFVIAGLALGSIYALSGIGLVLLYRASGTLNFAQGAYGALAVLIGWELNQVYLVALLPALAVGFLAGTGPVRAVGPTGGPGHGAAGPRRPRHGHARSGTDGPRAVQLALERQGPHASSPQ